MQAPTDRIDEGCDWPYQVSAKDLLDLFAWKDQKDALPEKQEIKQRLGVSWVTIDRYLKLRDRLEPLAHEWLDRTNGGECHEPVTP